MGYSVTVSWGRSIAGAAAAAFIGLACSSSSSSAAPAPAGDMFFRSVYATATESGELDVVVSAGSSGGAGGGDDAGTTVGLPGPYVQAVLYPSTGAPVVMNGTWTGSQDSASFSATGTSGTSVASVTGTVQGGGASATGSVTATDGSQGSFAGQNIREGSVQTYCGTYAGDYSGVWNFVVSGGSLTGAFAGDASGSLSGSATSSSVSITINDPGDGVTGTATGSFSGGGSSGQSVAGNWSVSGNSGTWTSSTVCVNAPTPAAPTTPPASEASCDPCGILICGAGTPGPHGGGCCGTRCCSYCAASD